VVQVDNTLRWRYSADDQGNYIVGDDGEYAKESNAKLVKWSDGSETLVLGESHIGVVRKDISTEVNCLLLQHDEQNLEALGLMNSKVSLKPMSANSKFHQRLTKTAAVAVEKKLKKMTSLKGATLDPNLQKQELDRTHSARINASRRREEKQYAEREKHARGAPMSRDFLEEGIADDDAGYMQTAYSDDEAVESEEEEPEKVRFTSPECVLSERLCSPGVLFWHTHQAMYPCTLNSLRHAQVSAIELMMMRMRRRMARMTRRQLLLQTLPQKVCRRLPSHCTVFVGSDAYTVRFLQYGKDARLRIAMKRIDTVLRVRAALARCAVHSLL
jgi:hypothetical protein